MGQLLKSGRTGDTELLMRRLMPKPEEAPDVHDILWSLVGYSYLGANDYTDAERVATERLRVAQAPIFLSLMAEVYRVQGKHAAAYPLYSRLEQLWIEDQLPADFQKLSEIGLVECLILRGEAAMAELVSRPPTDPDGSAVGPSFHEDIFNTHAIAMEEAGHKPAAAQFAAKIDGESRRIPAANQQDRGLFRARLMSARKQDAAAEAIYRKWTGYWKPSDAPSGMDPKEFLQIRAVALTAYSHFLGVRGRSREAQAIQARLAAARCRFGICEW